MRSPFSLVGQSKQKQINESWIVRASLMVRVLREGMPWSEAHIPLTSLTKLAFIFFSFLVFWGWIQILHKWPLCSTQTTKPSSGVLASSHFLHDVYALVPHFKRYLIFVPIKDYTTHLMLE